MWVLCNQRDTVYFIKQLKEDRNLQSVRESNACLEIASYPEYPPCPAISRWIENTAFHNTASLWRNKTQVL